MSGTTIFLGRIGVEVGKCRECGGRGWRVNPEAWNTTTQEVEMCPVCKKDPKDVTEHPKESAGLLT